MKLSDMDGILYGGIYVRSKFAAGVANWKHSHRLFFPLGRLAGSIKPKSWLSHVSVLGTSLLPFKKLLLLADFLHSLLQHVAIVPSEHILFLCVRSTERWKNLAVRVPQPLTSPTRKAIGEGWSSKPERKTDVIHIWHLQQEGEISFPDAQLGANHNDFLKCVGADFSL